jgi:PAB-dependent poly(A)-specific ribonuclease subunit 3
MMGGYDPFTNAMQGMTSSQQQSSLNPYAQDLTSMAATSGFFNPATDFQQPVSSSNFSTAPSTFLPISPPPVDYGIWERHGNYMSFFNSYPNLAHMDPNRLEVQHQRIEPGPLTYQIQYHLYAPMGTDRKRLEGYQRLVHDLFMPQELREDLQKKSEATLRVLPTSNLPTAIAHFHSLYPLDTSATKNAALFGYPTSIYKAKSAQDGRYYALRRVEGFRLTSEAAIHTVQKWKQVRSAGLVTVHEAFTTREFGDSSLILITDYHPNSKTLLEKHFNYNSSRPGGSGNSSRGQTGSYVREDILWSYIVQIAHALKVIHSTGLAARVIHPSKVLLTSKNRIRLNGCAITDIVTYESLKDVKEAQQDDFVQFGKLILSIASSNANAVMNVEKAVMNLTRLTYSNSLKQTITWLLNPPQSHSVTTTIQAGSAMAAQQPRPGTPSQTTQSYTKDIDTLLQAIALQSTRVLESALAAEDQLLSSLMSELENGRLVRLLAKLGCINERPEYEHNSQWSESGERYYLKLFRDYVFHQVNADGTPNVDLGHIVSCLNKLDAGTEEKVCLTSRDEQTCLVVSYKELKKGVESAFNELLRTGRR